MKVFITYSLGSNLKGKYSIVEGDDYTEIFQKITEVTNGDYAFSYDIEELPSMIERWALEEVPLQRQVRQ